MHTIATQPEIFEAKERPPPTTRARLRGEFVRRAQAAHRDYTVDWVHLRLNGRTQRTVMCPTRSRPPTSASTGSSRVSSSRTSLPEQLL